MKYLLVLLVLLSGCSSYSTSCFLEIKSQNTKTGEVRIKYRELSQYGQVEAVDLNDEFYCVYARENAGAIVNCGHCPMRGDCNDVYSLSVKDFKETSNLKLNGTSNWSYTLSFVTK